MHRTRCLPAISLSVCESVCVGAQSNGTRAECSLFQRMLELDWNAVNLASSQQQQHQQRPGPTTIERVGASAAELPSQWANEATRCADYEADAASDEMRDARCCRLCLFAVTASLRQLVAHSSFRSKESEWQLKRAPAELAIHIQQRENEREREWERMRAEALKALACFCPFIWLLFCLFLFRVFITFLLNSAVPYCEREKGVGGGDKRRDVCFVVPCANLDNLLACKQFNRWSAELAKCHLCCSKKCCIPFWAFESSNV